MGLYRLKVNADGAYRLNELTYNGSTATETEISSTRHEDLFGVTKTRSYVTEENPVINLNHHGNFYPFTLDDTIIVENSIDFVLCIKLSEVVIQTFDNKVYQIYNTENKETLYMYFYEDKTFGGFVVKDKQNAIPTVDLYNTEGELVKKITSNDLEEEFPDGFNVEGFGDDETEDPEEPDTSDTDSTEIETGQLRLRVYTEDSKTAMNLKEKIQNLSPISYELRTLFNYDKPCNEWGMTFATIGEIKTAVQSLETYCNSNSKILRYEIYTTLKKGGG